MNNTNFSIYVRKAPYVNMSVVSSYSFRENLSLTFNKNQVNVKNVVVNQQSLASNRRLSSFLVFGSKVRTYQSTELLKVSSNFINSVKTTNKSLFEYNDSLGFLFSQHFAFVANYGISQSCTQKYLEGFRFFHYVQNQTSNATPYQIAFNSSVKSRFFYRKALKALNQRTFFSGRHNGAFNFFSKLNANSFKLFQKGTYLMQMRKDNSNLKPLGRSFIYFSRKYKRVFRFYKKQESSIKNKADAIFNSIIQSKTQSSGKVNAPVAFSSGDRYSRYTAASKTPRPGKAAKVSSRFRMKRFKQITQTKSKKKV